jgi:hypothetical protein
LVANPRTSRTASADPRDPATVEKRTNTRVFVPGACRNLAFVYFASDVCSSNVPWAPAPRA